jgi:hypothetical protein
MRAGLLSLAMVLGCGTSKPFDTGDAGGPAEDSPSSMPDAQLVTEAGQDTGAGDCYAGTEKIYLVGSKSELVSFDPQTMNATKLGTIACQGNTATPMSMAVDRKAQAWVEMSDGKIFKVDIPTRACSDTGYVANQNGIKNFGMAFALDQPMGMTETLYISDAAGTGLGKIDTTTMKLDFIGPYDPPYMAPGELTGRGDGKLFGFFVQIPVTIAGIDKSNAKVLTFDIPSPANVGSSWAFAAWGGAFWIFTTKPGMPGTTSHVDKYDPNTMAIATVKNDVGIEVVGAGVSTCAPFGPPK